MTRPLYLDPRPTVAHRVLAAAIGACVLAGGLIGFVAVRLVERFDRRSAQLATLFEEMNA